MDSREGDAAMLTTCQLHWLPIKQQITYKIAVITCKTRTTDTPA